MTSSELMTMSEGEGVLTMSIEVELAWGLKESRDYQGLSQDRERETAAMDSILSISENDDVPLTFDFVGHLLLEGCDGNHYHGHPEGWFDKDPGTDVTRDPLWYAPDLVEKVLDVEVEHEVATHTFSHLWVDQVKPEVIRWELERVKELHEKRDLDRPKSLVFPQNRTPTSYEPLVDSGIKVVRVSPQDEARVSKPRMLWNDLFSKSPHDGPAMNEGVLETYGSHRASLTGNYLPHGKKPPHLFYRLLPIPKGYWKERHKRKLKNELEQVMEEGSHIHLWSHLWEMSNEHQMEIFRDLMDIVGEKKKEGLKVRTMKQLWKNYENTVG